MTIEQATEIAKRHGFEVKDGKVLIPWTNFSIRERGVDAIPLPSTLSDLRDLLGY